MTVYVEALSLVNALGEDDAILANLAEGRAPGMEGPLVRTVDGFEAPFGRVTIDLPDTNPPSSRNNRLLRACWNLRKTEFESRLKDFEDERIAVVLGLSTSESDCLKFVSVLMSSPASVTRVLAARSFPMRLSQVEMQAAGLEKRAFSSVV